MTVTQARRICRAFYEKNRPTEEEEFAYLEALGFLVEETKDPAYMAELGGYHYECRRFDLALRYYELAAEQDNIAALGGLGYIWYYGRTGERNYEKAFTYYSRAAQLGDIICAYKVADMYKNGYYVEKDMDKYRKIIESLYPKVKDAHRLGEPLPEIFTRLARIRTEQGRMEEAVSLYWAARDFLAQRIRYDGFFGNLNIMKWLIKDLYRITDFDGLFMDLYDLYYVLKEPAEVTFYWEDEKQQVRAVQEEEGLAICFNGKWFRTVDDFFAKANIGGNRLTAIYEDLYDFELGEEAEEDA